MSNLPYQSFENTKFDDVFTTMVFGNKSSLVVQIALAGLYGVLSIVGLLTNIIVVCLLVTIRRRALANITNLFVLALAISDIFLCAFNMPMQVYHELNVDSYVTPLYCRIVFSTFGIPIHFSCFTILLIAIDRYRIIVYPLLARMTSRLAISFILFVFLISVIMTIPVALLTDSMAYIQHETSSDKATGYEYEKKHRMCLEDWPTPASRLAYSILVYIVQFALPLLITACLYTKIYRRLHERRFRKRDAERKRRTNKILMGIVMCFAFCWTPWVTFSLYLEIQEFVASHELIVSARYVTPYDAQQFGWTSKSNFSESPQDKASINIAKIPSPSLKTRFNHTTRLIDFILKLLAMGSACFNPWLYGWLNDSLCTYVKRHKRKWTRYARHKKRYFQRFWTKYFRKRQGNFDEYAYNNEDLSKDLHLVRCCGFYCAVRTGFHSRKYQIAHLQAKDSPMLEGFGRNNSTKREGSLHGKGPSGSKSSHSLSGTKQKSSKGSCKTHNLYTYGPNTKDSNENNQTKQLNGNLLEQAVIQFHNSQSTRSSIARSSYASFATLSLFDQSTKRTSLFPSSVIVNSPRGSFLCSGAPNQPKPMENNRPNLTVGDGLMTNKLLPPPNNATLPANNFILPTFDNIEENNIKISVPDFPNKLTNANQPNNDIKNDVIQILVHEDYDIGQDERNSDETSLPKSEFNIESASFNRSKSIESENSLKLIESQNASINHLPNEQTQTDSMESSLKVNHTSLFPMNFMRKSSNTNTNLLISFDEENLSPNNMRIRSANSPAHSPSPNFPPTIKEDSGENTTIENDCVCESDENLSEYEMRMQEKSSRRNSSRKSSRDSHCYVKLETLEEQNELKPRLADNKKRSESDAHLVLKDNGINSGKDHKLLQDMLTKRRHTVRYNINKKLFNTFKRRLSHDASSVDSHDSQNLTDVSEKNDDSVHAGSREDSDCDDFAHFHKIVAKEERKKETSYVSNCEGVAQNLQNECTTVNAIPLLNSYKKDSLVSHNRWNRRTSDMPKNITKKAHSNVIASRKFQFMNRKSSLN